MDIEVCDDAATVEELSEQDGRAMSDSLARDLVGMSGAQFLRLRDAGELSPADDDAVVRPVGACAVRPLTPGSGAWSHAR